ncbi:1 TM domain-containing transmembrane protein, partial [Acrasis kona]
MEIIIVGGVVLIGCGVAAGVAGGVEAYKKRKEGKRKWILAGERMLDEHTGFRNELDDDIHHEHLDQIAPIEQKHIAPGQVVDSIDTNKKPDQFKLKSVVIKDEKGKKKISTKAGLLYESNGDVVCVSVPRSILTKLKKPHLERKLYCIDATTENKRTYKKVLLYYNGHNQQDDIVFSN